MSRGEDKRITIILRIEGELGRLKMKKTFFFK